MSKKSTTIKIFLSQPMSGKTDKEIMEEREQLTKIAEGLFDHKGYTVKILDSYFDGFSEDISPLYYLSKSLRLLSMADYAIFSKDWKKYRGCQIEKSCCDNYDIPYWDESRGNISIKINESE